MVLFWDSEVVLEERGGFEAAAAMVRAARRCLFGVGKKKGCLHGTERCNEA